LLEPSEDQLLELLELSEAVFVGRVRERRETPGGVDHQVEVLEVLSTRVGDEAEWPHATGDLVRVSSFLYRPGAPLRRVGPLEPPTRYLFFAARMERKGEWLNLEDTSGLPLPDTEETLRAVRRLTAGGGPEPSGR
jgi:hypothetical protein